MKKLYYFDIVFAKAVRLHKKDGNIITYSPENDTVDAETDIAIGLEDYEEAILQPNDPLFIPHQSGREPSYINTIGVLRSGIEHEPKPWDVTTNGRTWTALTIADFFRLKDTGLYDKIEILVDQNSGAYYRNKDGSKVELVGWIDLMQFESGGDWEDDPMSD